MAKDDAKAEAVKAAPDSGWPEHKVKVKMHDKEQVAPDGHVNLSQADIDARV
jgi:hypothetical protein